VVAALCVATARAYADGPDGGAPDGGAQPDAGPAPISAPAAPALALLRGRVFERGSVNPIAGARVSIGEGVETTTDKHGRFELPMPGGTQSVAIIAEDYDPLHVTENMVAGQGLAVEYRLLAKDERKRFRSRVRGEAHHEGERFTLTDQELHMAPGSLGDPFRVIAMLPGVQAPVPLLPLWVVRGAAPGTTGFFLDGMRVPQLFHFLLGGGVVHARMIDDVQFYPSAYDATFGRFAGGIIDGTTRSARDGYHAELELKVYDVGGLFETTQKGVHIEVGGHYGWPAFIIKAFDSSANLAYWDYQLRIDWKGLTVEALGSFDTLSFSHTQMQPDGALPIKVSDAFRLAFYRLQIRDRERWGRVELETALVGGIDQMASFGGVGVQKLSLNARSNLSVRWKRVRLLAGVELELQRFTAKDFSPQLAAAEPDELGDFSGNRGGVVGGGYAEGVIDLIPQRLTATLGARLDFYHAQNVTLLGFDPRAQVKAKLLPWLSVGGGTGIYQQAPSFPVGLPGIDTFALQLGLQRSWQSAVDIQVNFPKDIDFKITGFYQRFWNMNDIVLDFTTVLCTSPPPESLTGFAAQVTRQLNGDAFGMEVLLRRKVGRVTGWIAYTLSRSEREYSCGMRPSDFDQTHVLNIVVQVRLPWKLIFGTHLEVATGRPYTKIGDEGINTPRNNARLPTYVQVDLRLDREWVFKKWAIAAFLEILNATYSETIFGIASPGGMSGIPLLNDPSLDAFHWILPTIGVRGRI
jgi:hypothetical protein